jgi:2,3-bisphosphoglycerate-independent phosphoglycerate mutase
MAIRKPVVLVILDGFGYSKQTSYNAVTAAHMHNFNNWLAEYPHALLKAAGTAVGLAPDTPGNSLVGHLALGAGRVVQQPATVLNDEIASGEFFKNPLLIKRFQELKNSGGTLQLMGLLSDGQSHSDDTHLYALLRMAHQQGLTKIVVHAFLDGRDVPPKSAAVYLARLDDVFKEIGCGVLGSIHGRFYPMERSDSPEYINKSYDILTKSHQAQFSSWREALDYYYARHIYDEMIPPTTLVADSYIHDGDGLIFFNIRADRARNLTRLFTQAQHPKLLWFITGVRYVPNFSGDVLCDLPVVDHTLLDVLEEAQKKFFVIAEHEKYAHVTYFFNGGREIVHPHESRVIIPSLPADKFAQHPEMSAPEITKAVLSSLTQHARDFYLINYANPDMVGHTGNFEATVKAVQCIDRQLKKLYEQVVEKMAGTLYIVADHGKAEEMRDPVTHQPKTAHTANPVYFLMLQKNLKNGSRELPLHQLADVAPFILKQMQLPVPVEMKH